MTIKSSSKSHPLTTEFDRLIEAVYLLFGPVGSLVRPARRPGPSEGPRRVRRVLKGREEQYQQAVADLKAPGRDLLRLHDKFAIIYALYCAAIRFKIFPCTEAELLEAVMAYERARINRPAKGARHITFPRGGA